MGTIKPFLTAALLVVSCGIAGYIGSALGRGGLPASARVSESAMALGTAQRPAAVSDENSRPRTRRAPLQVPPEPSAAPQHDPERERHAGSLDEQLVAEMQAEERDIARGVQHQQSLERAFELEPVDEGWARPAEASFREAAGQLFSEPDTTAISAMECRSTLCKAVFTHEDRAAQEAFSGSERYLDLIQPFPQSFFVHERAGAAAASTVVFLSRDQGGLVAQLDSMPKAAQKP
jgi:hypothetical protein